MWYREMTIEMSAGEATNWLAGASLRLQLSAEKTILCHFGDLGAGPD